MRSLHLQPSCGHTSERKLLGKPVKPIHCLCGEIVSSRQKRDGIYRLKRSTRCQAAGAILSHFAYLRPSELDTRGIWTWAKLYYCRSSVLVYLVVEHIRYITEIGASQPDNIETLLKVKAAPMLFWHTRFCWPESPSHHCLSRLAIQSSTPDAILLGSTN